MIVEQDVGWMWLVDGKNCLKAKNNEEFNAKLHQIMNSDNSKMIEEGYKVVEERTLDKIGARLKEIYEEFYNETKK